MGERETHPQDAAHVRGTWSLASAAVPRRSLETLVTERLPRRARSAGDGRGANPRIPRPQTTSPHASCRLRRTPDDLALTGTGSCRRSSSDSKMLRRRALAVEPSSQPRCDEPCSDSESHHGSVSQRFVGCLTKDQPVPESCRVYFVS